MQREKPVNSVKIGKEKKGLIKKSVGVALDCNTLLTGSDAMQKNGLFKRVSEQLALIDDCTVIFIHDGKSVLKDIQMNTAKRQYRFDKESGDWVNPLASSIQIITPATLNVYKRTFESNMHPYFRALHEELITYSLFMLKSYYGKELNLDKWLSFLSAKELDNDIVTYLRDKLKGRDMVEESIDWLNDYYQNESRKFEYTKGVRVWLEEMSRKPFLKVNLQKTAIDIEALVNENSLIWLNVDKENELDNWLICTISEILLTMNTSKYSVRKSIQLIVDDLGARLPEFMRLVKLRSDNSFRIFALLNELESLKTLTNAMDMPDEDAYIYVLDCFPQKVHLKNENRKDSAYYLECWTQAEKNLELTKQFESIEGKDFALSYKDQRVIGKLSS